jgi:DNA-binding beta-propeller fold protein YncE
MPLLRRVASLATLFTLPLAITTGQTPERLSLGTQPDGSTLVPSNQAVTPIGVVRRIELGRPKDLALSPDGKTLAVLNSNSLAGVLFFSTEGVPLGSVAFHAGAVGIAWAPDGKTVYASGSDGKVARLEKTETGWRLGEAWKLGADKENPQPTGLAVSPDGKWLYVALGIRNTVVVLNLKNDDWGESTLPVGVAPYRLLLSPDGKRLYVANRGGRWVDRKETATEPSAGTPVRVDRQTDAALRGSISVIDTDHLFVQSVREVEVGRQPSGLAISPDGRTLFIANADDDTVSFLDTRARRITQTLSVRPKEDPGFGQMPTAVALAEDGKTLYAACGGGNAVAVIALGSHAEVKGYLPTGWFPSALLLHDGQLMVASAKGLGPRPEGKINHRWYVHDSVGTLQFIPDVAHLDLAAQSRTVARNNHWGLGLPARPGTPAVPVPERVGEPSVFRHVVYILKENQTYDSILGDMPEGNGDKSLNLYGEAVTPNHHALARQFVLLDNTYTSGTNSADGHQWCDEAIANAYVEQNYAAHTRSYPFDGGDPLAYSPAGFLWNAVARQGLDVRVYGEFVNRPGMGGGKLKWEDVWKDYQQGTHKYKITAWTDNLALRPYLHPHYVGWPIEVSDQWRADQFLADLADFEKRDKMPSLCLLLLPCDHTNGTSPDFPTPRASLADNDLALGRIVEGISHSRFWKETLILVIEDDSQHSVDHVDGHRTTAFCISPYTRRGTIVSEMYNHTSLLRTIELVLGLPPMTRFDRTATPLTACFTAAPDLRPYTHVANRVSLNEMNPPARALRGEARRLAEACTRLDWSAPDRADPAVVARAVWQNRKPGQPFPTQAFQPDRDNDD